MIVPVLYKFCKLEYSWNKFNKENYHLQCAQIRTEISKISQLVSFHLSVV